MSTMSSHYTLLVVISHPCLHHRAAAKITRDDAIVVKVVATAAACVRTSAADAHYWKIYDGPKKGSLSHEK